MIVLVIKHSYYNCFKYQFIILTYIMGEQFFKVSTEAVYRRLSLILNEKSSIVDKPFVLLIGKG